MTSWKSPDDPARGNIAGILVPDGYPEIIELEDSKVKYRAGPWNGLQFSGVPQVKPNPVYTFEFVFNEKEIFYREQLKNSSRYWRIVLTQNGDLMHLLWMEQTQNNGDSTKVHTKYKAKKRIVTPGTNGVMWS
ncbi:hypothetical protein OIU84_003223 [Salix udensis]|uniref:S-locus glycoprotein domain-containing protein n=1 Tax=Salix udensis TaxID=889485 RepID=A0AAD6K5W7_9ROSI|nr:hypothetical protein OIU84_003223 [Salix udensis]